MILISLLISLLVVGCSAYTMPALTADYPANPAAPAMPRRQASRTLAYTASDAPSSRPGESTVLAQQSDHERHNESQAARGRTVTGEGKVVATVPNANQIVIDHGPINGFMDPMTMGYQVDTPSLLQGLNAGDRIRFTIDVEKKTIVKVEKLQS